MRSPAARRALSKYQFETATGIGMRHTFHRPLWSAFHFYLYLPPARAASPYQPRFYIRRSRVSVYSEGKREGKPGYR